jgi:hypothetical protein
VVNHPPTLVKAVLLATVARSVYNPSLSHRKEKLTCQDMDGADEHLPTAPPAAKTGSEHVSPLPPARYLPHRELLPRARRLAYRSPLRQPHLPNPRRRRQCPTTRAVERVLATKLVKGVSGATVAVNTSTVVVPMPTVARKRARRALVIALPNPSRTVLPRAH